MQQIKETQNYKLVLGESQDTNKVSLYQVVNKQYEVVEVETTILPQAIKFLHDLEASLAAAEDYSKGVEISTKGLPEIHQSRPRSVN